MIDVQKYGKRNSRNHLWGGTYEDSPFRTYVEIR